MSLENQLTKAENDLQVAKTKFITGWIMFGGGFLGIFVSAAAMDSGAGGGAWLFMFISLAISLSGLAYSGDNGAAAQEEIDGLKASIKQRRNRELQRKKDLERREQELEFAKELMEEGGIGNLNKAIGIFEKYGK